MDALPSVGLHEFLSSIGVSGIFNSQVQTFFSASIFVACSQPEFHAKSTFFCEKGRSSCCRLSGLYFGLLWATETPNGRGIGWAWPLSLTVRQ